MAVCRTSGVFLSQLRDGFRMCPCQLLHQALPAVLALVYRDEAGHTPDYTGKVGIHIALPRLVDDVKHLDVALTAILFVQLVCRFDAVDTTVPKSKKIPPEKQNLRFALRRDVFQHDCYKFKKALDLKSTLRIILNLSENFLPFLCGMHSLSVNICADCTVLETQHFDVVVDALYGTGFHGALRPSGLAACGLMNRLHKSGAFVLAVDLPSGINTDTGEVAEGAAHADLTVTFDSYKPLHVAESSAPLCGKIVCSDIGIRDEWHPEF